MRTSVRHLFLQPRLWFCGAALCFGMSLLIGYHHDQVVAHQKLADIVELPSAVKLQDFNPRDHSNALNEVHLIGEAALDRAITLNIGDAHPNWVRVVPFFPVSVSSLLTTYQHIEQGSIHEMPQQKKVRLASDAWRIRGLQDTPMGMLLIEDGTSIDAALMHEPIGDGRHGPLVVVAGSTFEEASVNALAVAAFDRAGTKMLSDMPMIMPYPNGQRFVGATEDRSNLQYVFGLATLALLLMGFYARFSTPADLPRKESGYQKPVEPLLEVSNVFADAPLGEEAK